MFFILYLFSIGVLGIARDPGAELPPLTRGANFSPWDKFRSALGTREKTCYRLIREKYA